MAATNNNIKFIYQLFILEIILMVYIVKFGNGKPMLKPDDGKNLPMTQHVQILDKERIDDLPRIDENSYTQQPSTVIDPNGKLAVNTGNYTVVNLIEPKRTQDKARNDDSFITYFYGGKKGFSAVEQVVIILIMLVFVGCCVQYLWDLIKDTGLCQRIWNFFIKTNTNQTNTPFLPNSTTIMPK